MDNIITLGDNADDYDLSAGWRKSSYSMSNGHCVETASLASSRIGVRDSKVVNGPVLSFGPRAWASFVAGLRASE
jgi:hypothetical protein